MDYEESLLELMKTRIIQSYRWRNGIVVPLADELEIDPDDFEKILIRKLDMSSLEALHPRFESALPRCIKERLHADLKLCWLCDVMEIISNQQAETIKTKITKEILDGKEYEDALEDGKKELMKILME